MIYSEQIEWKDIKGYENLYQVSNTGLVKSIGRNVDKKMFGGNIGSYFREEKILKPGNNRDYLHVTLRKNNKSNILKVHRLVLQTFNNIDNCELLQVNHKDGNKSNNNLTNLEWITQQDNQLHRYQELYNDRKLSKHSYITKSNGKWRLRGFKNKHIGYFKTEELAKEKYDRLVLSNPELFRPVDYTKHDKIITENDLF